ncbi:hypothetical protein GCM10020254_53810 [Streptomyces goshikiensis]
MELFGFGKKELVTALVAAAVAVRLPHPAAPAALPERAAPAAGALAGEAAAEDHDALLRRLQELGDLRAKGILTDEEFAETKALILRRF